MCNTLHALILVFTLGVAVFNVGCGSDNAALERNTRDQVLALLEDAGQPAERVAGELERVFTRAEDKHHVTAVLVNWATMHPERFAVLVRHFTLQGFVEEFAISAAAEGKTFLLVERLDSDDVALQAMLETLRRIENRDRRVKVPAYRLAPDSPLQRIARVSANHAGKVWEGGAILLLESECQLAFAAAGHTFSGEFGEPRAPLENFQLGVAGRTYRVDEVVASRRSAEPEHDWALVIVNKDNCGSSVSPGPVIVPSAVDIPQGGLDVNLYCYQQGPSDMTASLYEEQCRIYASDSGVLDHYAHKPSGLLGVHSCRSEKGSSGCPLMINNAGDLQFVGTQIERDSLTRAGIARLFSQEFRGSLARINARFAADDQAYALKHRPQPVP